VAKTIAGGPYADQGARGGGACDEVGHPAGRLLGPAALQAEHLPRRLAGGAPRAAATVIPRDRRPGS
jgi:hypothetical protein